MLGDWPARGSGSLAARLAFSLRSRILADLLPPGSALPPERGLARALAVSRSTLVEALDLLRPEGLIVSRQGSGTRVTGGGAAAVGPGLAEASPPAGCGRSSWPATPGAPPPPPSRTPPAPTAPASPSCSRP